MTDRAVHLSTAKGYVFSDLVLCLGIISESPVIARKEKIDWFMNSSKCREMDRIDGEPMEFEWKNIQGFTTLQILAEIQNMMTETQCELKQFQGRMIFISMFHDIVWVKEGNKNCALRIPRLWQIMREDSHTYVGRFSGLDQKRNGSELVRTNRRENGIESLRR